MKHTGMKGSKLMSLLDTIEDVAKQTIFTRYCTYVTMYMSKVNFKLVVISHLSCICACLCYMQKIA